MKIDDEFIASQKIYLQDLIAFKEHPKTLQEFDRLGFKDWYDLPLAIITREHVSAVLERYLKGLLTAGDIYDWAESLAGRSTIGYENNYDKLISSIIMNIVTDHITGISLTEQQAIAYLSQLHDNI